MSGHSLSDILKNETALVAQYDLDNRHSEILQPRDVKGYSLREWLDQAVVGWDEPLQSYFLQCIETGDELVWWLGTTYREIPTFAALCKLIGRIFGNQVAFEFTDTIERI